MKKMVSLALIVLMTGFLFEGFLPARAAGPDRMVSFSLPSAVDDTLVNSEAFEGKVVLMAFFSTLCRPCVKEIPTLIRLHDEFSDQGFSVLALSVDRSGPKPVKKLITREEVTYPVLMADHKIQTAFGVGPLPAAFLLDRHGRVVKKYLGLVRHARFKQDIKAHL